MDLGRTASIIYIDCQLAPSASVLHDCYLEIVKKKLGLYHLQSLTVFI